MSHDISQSFWIREDIHIYPVILAPRDWRWEFWVYGQLCDTSPMKDCSHPISPLFMNALATELGRYERGGGDRFPLHQVDILCIIADISWGADLLRSPNLISIFLSFTDRITLFALKHICYVFNNMSISPHSFLGWIHPSPLRDFSCGYLFWYSSCRPSVSSAWWFFSVRLRAPQSIMWL